MSIDFKIYRELLIVGIENPKIIKKLEDWTNENSEDFYGWSVEYFRDQICLQIKESTKGLIDDYIKILIKFLNECAKYDIYMTDSVPYGMDDESGGIHICSKDKRALIIAVTDCGDIIKRDIEWL